MNRIGDQKHTKYTNIQRNTHTLIQPNIPEHKQSKTHNLTGNVLIEI